MLKVALLVKALAAGIRPHLKTAIGSAISIGACAYLSYRYFEPRNSTLLIGSFGASTVILYTTMSSRFAQPRSVVGGHLISALSGVVAFKLLGGTGWAAAALAVLLAITAMQLTETLHPPGGATALIAVMAGESGGVGFDFVLIPVALGAAMLVAVAWAVHRISGQSYPFRRH